MSNKIKEAFNQIQAESELKNKTKDFIFQKTHGYKQTKTVNYKHMISAFACIAILLIGGYWIYFIPTVKISIDINPSVELGINRFNRIISFEGYGDDGRELTNSFHIKFMKYPDAVTQITESEDILSLLSSDEVMTISVIGTDSIQSEEVLHNMQSYTSEKNNTYCFFTCPDEVENAHKVGLSYGKYRAYLELQAVNPNITADEIQNMTMREIRDMINSLSTDKESRANHFGNGHGNRHQGNKKGQGSKNRWEKSANTHHNPPFQKLT